MKKILAILLASVLLLGTGCTKQQEPAPTVEPTQEATEKPVEKKKIELEQMPDMEANWTVLADFETPITNAEADDRIILATSAKTTDGNIEWDDSQAWNLVVITENGAYNLFSSNVNGRIYAEVNEMISEGKEMPVITAYIFGAAEHTIINYIYKEGVFEEDVVYQANQITNNMYSSFPNY